VEAGCLPNLLPGGRPVADPKARVDTSSTWGSASLPSVVGRDADEMLLSAGDQELAALVVAGVDPGDFLDPQAALAGLEAIGFVVSLETRTSLVTERADVVLPVSLIEERSGTFFNWEGRDRPFGVVIERPNTMTDLRVLAALADGLGHDLGIRTPAQARDELAELGLWEGDRAPAPAIGAARPPKAAELQPVLATWRLLLDDSRALDGEPYLLASARRPVARLSAATAGAAQLGGSVTLSSDRGSMTFPVEIVPGMVDDVVWVPTRAPGHGLFERLALTAGDVVRISPGGATMATSSDLPLVMTYPGVTEGVGG
jgi:NADH-quinone oxidoreductase subunit G